MIPKVIYMCDKELRFIERYSENWKNLNPEYEIKLYDDKMCEDFLRNEFSELHYEIFKYIKDGPIKADFWRVCIIYKYGGIYVDADVKPLVSIDKFIDTTSDFIICTSLSFFNFMDPIFMATHPNNEYLKKCIDVYIEKYNNTSYNYYLWSIMTVMRYNNIFQLDKLKKKYGLYKVNYLENDNYIIQLLEENKDDNTSYGDHAKYNSMRVFNCRYKNYCNKMHKFLN
jgi:hypothetical protein